MDSASSRFAKGVNCAHIDRPDLSFLITRQTVMLCTSRARPVISLSFPHIVVGQERFSLTSNSSAGTSLMLRSNDRSFLFPLCGIQEVALILKNSRYVCLVVFVGSVVIGFSPTSPYIELVRRLCEYNLPEVTEFSIEMPASNLLSGSPTGKRNSHPAFEPFRDLYVR